MCQNTFLGTGRQKEQQDRTVDPHGLWLPSPGVCCPGRASHSRLFHSLDLKQFNKFILKIPQAVLYLWQSGDLPGELTDVSGPSGRGVPALEHVTTPADASRC